LDYPKRYLTGLPTRPAIIYKWRYAMGDKKSKKDKNKADKQKKEQLDKKKEQQKAKLPVKKPV